MRIWWPKKDVCFHQIGRHKLVYALPIKADAGRLQASLRYMASGANFYTLTCMFVSYLGVKEQRTIPLPALASILLVSSILATESHFCIVPCEFSPCLCRTSALAQPPNSPPWKISQRLLQMHPLQIEFWISPGWGLWDMHTKMKLTILGTLFDW